MKKFFDLEGRELMIGDLILLSKGSDIMKTYVLGFTNVSVIVSIYRAIGRWDGGNLTVTPSPTGNIQYSVQVDNHNAKQYRYVYNDDKHANAYILSRNNEIPDNLQKFIKRGQL